MPTTTVWAERQNAPAIISGIATIDAGNSSTLAIPNHGRAVVRIGIPAMDSANLTFTVQPYRPDNPADPTIDPVFRTLKDAAGNTVTVTGGTGDFVCEVPELSGCYAFTIESSAQQTSDVPFEVQMVGMAPIPFEAAASGAVTLSVLDTARLASAGRVHVHTPYEWTAGGGTDWWAQFGPESIVPGGLLAPPLADFGWTLTSLVETAGSGADLLNLGSGSPAHLLTDASGDLLQSPQMFGAGATAAMAQRVLYPTNPEGQPNKLCVEFAGAMTVHSANELTRSGWGWVTAGGTAGVAADRVAWIGTDGANFGAGNPGASDLGAADDALWHVFRLVLFDDQFEWFIDGTSQGVFASVANCGPVSFGMFAFTTNRPAIAAIHIWYETV